LPYNSHIPEPRGLDLFTKGLVEAGINKDLIENEYFLSKMAKEEYEMPQSESDVESESGEVFTRFVKWTRNLKRDNESEYDDDDGDENEDDDESDESEKLACNHCGKETGHIVYLMKCPRCSWKDFYWGKNAQCICDEQSPLLFSHVIGFCELCSYGTSNSKAGGVEFTPKMDK
jgi:hypothetical protein